MKLRSLCEGKNVLLSCSSSWNCDWGGNGKHFYICDKAPRISFIWIRNCLFMAQAVTIGPHARSPSLPTGAMLRLASRRSCGSVSYCSLLLIMSNSWCLFASRIVCTCFPHPGLLLALKKKNPTWRTHLGYIVRKYNNLPPPQKKGSTWFDRNLGRAVKWLPNEDEWRKLLVPGSCQGSQPRLLKVWWNLIAIYQCHIWAKSEQYCSHFSQMDRSTLIFIALVEHLFDVFPLARQ